MPEGDVALEYEGGWQRVSPIAAMDFLVAMVRHGFFQALPAMAVGFVSAWRSDAFPIGWVITGIMVLVLLALGWSVLGWLRFGYRLFPDRIEVRKGVVHRETLKLTFDRVQNVSVQEPFYMRPFGMAVIGIDTAGSSGKEIRLPGIRLEPARQMRQKLVLAAEGAAPQAGAGAAERPDDGRENARGEVLARLTRRDVIIAGLTANFMLWAAIAFATAMGSGYGPDDMFGWVSGRLNLADLADVLLETGGQWLLSLAILAAVLLAIILLPLISVIGALFRYDGYTLSVDGDRFRAASGLLSRHDHSVRQHKIQAVTWKQNAIAVLFGRINLLLRQASSGLAADMGGQPGAPGERNFQVPSLRPEEAADLTTRFLPGSDAQAAQWTGVDQRAYLVVNGGWILAFPALGLVTAAWLVHPAFLGLLAVITAAVTLITWRCWKQAGWAVEGNFGLLRHGFIGSSTTVFPLAKVQRIDLVQTPLQARRGLAHLVVHLASHSMTVHWLRHEDAERFRDLAIERAESARQPWF